MARQQQEKLVHCRYPKCSKLHETTELKKEDAVQGGKGNYYYHPDCYNTLQTINKIRDLFIKEINPMMTGQQIGMLVSTVNNMVFSKKIAVDYILFALEYFVKYKPGKLHQPFGMHYIVQDKDVIASWKKEQGRKIRAEVKTQLKNNTHEDNEEIGLDLSDADFTYKPSKPRSFADILG